jgi:outer membrane protein
LVSGGLNASRARESRASRTAARLERVDAERRVRETVTSAWTGLEAARAARISAAEQVKAAEDAYRGVSLERETGLRATVEVLDQEQDLLDARIALAQAEREFVVAERQLLSALGALTPQ